MKTLQEILDEFNKTKLGQLNGGKLQQHINGTNVASRVNTNVSRLKSMGKTLGSTVGKFNLTDYSREMSKVSTTCPNCNTVGPLSNMRQHHFDNCKRTVGYSDNLIIENHKKGMSASQISQDSNVSYPQTKSIIRNYKKSLAV